MKSEGDERREGFTRSHGRVGEARTEGGRGVSGELGTYILAGLRKAKSDRIHCFCAPARSAGKVKSTRKYTNASVNFTSLSCYLCPC